MKIRKLQEGGSAGYLSYTPTPMAQPSQPQATTGSSGGSKEKDITNDIIKEIYEKGVPSDVENMLEKISGFKGSVFGADGIKGLMSTTQGFNTIMSYVSKLRHNKDALTKARDNLYANGGLSEGAMTANGQVMVFDDKNQPQQVSIEKLASDPGKYRVMSNNELLEMRSYDKGLGFNNTALSILSNGIGSSEVNKQVQTVISKLETTKNTSDQLVSPEQVEILRGINDLKGIVKVKNQSEEISNRQREAAKTYIYNMLDPNAKNLLRLKAAQQGLNPDAGAISLLENIITGTTKVNQEQGLNLSDVSGVSGSGSGSGSKDPQAAPTFRMMVQGNMFDTVPSEINLGTKMSIVSNASVFNRPYDDQGKPMSAGEPLNNVLDNAFGGTVDSSNIYFGNQKINAGDANKIVYTGEPGSVAMLPAINDGSNLSIDFDAMNRMAKANAEVKAGSITDKNLIKNIYEKHKVWQYHDSNPMKSGYMAEFVQLPVYAYDKGLIEDSGSPFYREVEGKEKDMADRYIKKGYSGKVDGDLDYLGWFGGDLYKTNVYMPKSNSLLESTIGSGAITVPKMGFETAIQRQSNLETARKMAQNHKATGAVTNKNVYNQ